MTRTSIVITLALFLSLAAGLVPAAAQVRYVPTPESRVWIEGRTNVNGFTCATQELNGEAWITTASFEEPAPVRGGTLTTAGLQDDSALLAVRVPVETLDCGERRQNRDMRRAMRAEKHPTITYELVSADLLTDADASDESFEIEAEGVLTIAGTARTVKVTLEAHRQDDGSVSARGSAPLRMTDFDIDPPSALLGIIRVRDQIEVHFDIVAVPESE